MNKNLKTGLTFALGGVFGFAVSTIEPEPESSLSYCGYDNENIAITPYMAEQADSYIKDGKTVSFERVSEGGCSVVSGKLGSDEYNETSAPSYRMTVHP